MGRFGSMDIRGLKEFQKKINQLQNPDKFVESCAKELAARLLAKVIKRTPVGDYSGDPKTCKIGTGKEIQHKGHKVKGKTGGTLRKGWTVGKKVSAKNFAESLKVHHFGDTYVIEIINPVEYASYVEFGHRIKRKNGWGWAGGHFMMTISVQELETIAPKVLEAKIMKYFEDYMK